MSTFAQARVSEPHSGYPGRPKGADKLTHRADRRNLFQRLVELVSPGPDSRDELIAAMADAEDRELIAPESRMMLEGVIRMADMTAGDVMVAAPRMDLLNIDAPYDELLHLVIGTGHSRFPVYGGQRDNIIGILMVKDLLKLQRSPDLNLRTLLRPAVFVPESKGLNELLRDFRANRNHLAIVIDEFGSTAGLITIEDVLEEIVGDIEDEHDVEEDSYIKPLPSGDFLIKALTPIENFNEFFDSEFSDDEFDTVGGLVMSAFGHLPKRNEITEIGPYRFRILNADSRRIHLLRLTPIAR